MAIAKMIKTLAILASGAVLMFSATVHALVTVTEIVNPKIALQFASNSPVALASLADIQWTEGKKAVNDVSVRTLTDLSLRQQAINPRALRQMGLALDVERKPEQAKGLLALASRLTRRDVGTELWHIEAAAAAGNVQAALTHYNFALLTNPESAKKALFPSLAVALDDSEIRTALIPLFRSNPEWLMDFMSYAISPAGKAEPLAQTIVASGSLKASKENAAIESLLIARLVDQKNFETAKQFYLSLNGVDRGLISSPTLKNLTQNARYAPIGWKLESAPGVGATADEQGKTPHIALYAAPGASGLAAQKLLFLAKGSYTLTYELSSVAINSAGSASLSVECLSQATSRPILKQDIISSKTGQIMRASFVVDASCPAQSLKFVLAGGEGEAETNFSIGTMSISAP
jgi:hypothetical protein